MIASLLGLIPDQDPETLGALLLIEFIVWSAVAGSQIVLSLRHMQSRVSLVSRLLLPVLGSVPFLVGALILLGDGSLQGLDWVAAGIVASTVAALINAWVLLVELRR